MRSSLWYWFEPTLTLYVAWLTTISTNDRAMTVITAALVIETTASMTELSLVTNLGGSWSVISAV